MNKREPPKKGGGKREYGPADDVAYLKASFPKETIGLGNDPANIVLRTLEKNLENTRKQLGEKDPVVATARQINGRLMYWLYRDGQSEVLLKLLGASAWDLKSDHYFFGTGKSNFRTGVHDNVFAFLARESGHVYVDWHADRMIKSDRKVIFPESAELIFYELVIQLPLPKKSDYVENLDDDLKLLQKWISQKGKL
ncbi:hypothetical protein N9Y42_02920 [Mariniblastus sp.]|nr:hypothetical protein [Mariniblastus sp.]